MRIHHIQRLIFGSLLLLILMYIGSVWGLAAAFDRGRASPAAEVPGNARMETKWSFEIPAREIWADAGTAAGTREIENYALSGTFQTYEMDSESSRDPVPVRSLALVDDLRNGRQSLLHEGDRLGPFDVQHVGLDQVTLRRGDQLYVLALSGEIATAPAQPEPAQKRNAPIRIEDMPAIETTRFGKKVSDNQWVIDREEVFRYADEVMNNPLRVVNLYRSFDQIAEKMGDKAGFKISMKGEQDFFRDMGLGDGDIIRKVNSMEMKTQLRAEYLVREFMKSRMSAVVLDVENNGETRKQIFIVR